MLDSPTTININYENDTRTTIRLIKVTDQQSSDSLHEASQIRELNSSTSRNLETSVSERFVESFGKIKLLEGGLIATSLDGYRKRSCVTGIGRYSSGVHYIRFRIEKLGEHFYSFLGIINSSENITLDILESKSCYGWWDPDYWIAGGKAEANGLTKINQTGDEVTLMLDCDDRRIQLEHHRAHRIVDMSIDSRLCAFPWKIIVYLCDKDDCVRILH